MAFKLENVQDLSGQNFIITGASSGIGLSASRMLVSKGAHVVMACRNLNKTQPLADDINSSVGSCGGKASVIRLDTTGLDSIDQFVPALLELGVDRLDGLLLNAGIMMVAYREIDTRSDKHPKMESQMACNVVGHFYLTHVLMDLIKKSPGVRVVATSSLMAKKTKNINYDVFFCEKPDKYSGVEAYCNSKLGDLLLVHELERRFKKAGLDAVAFGTHPGYTWTALQTKIDGVVMGAFAKFTAFVSMESDGGALPLVMAMTMPKEKSPDKPYFVPGGLFELRGAPIATGCLPKQGRDDEQALRLWEACEELCNMKSVI